MLVTWFHTEPNIEGLKINDRVDRSAGSARLYYFRGEILFTTDS